MRLSLRFVLPLAVAIGLIAYGVTPLVNKLIFHWFARDLDFRSTTLSTAFATDSLVPLFESGLKAKIFTSFKKIMKDERIYALAFCNLQGDLVYKTENLPIEIQCKHPEPKEGELGYSTVLNMAKGPVHVAFRPLQNEEGYVRGELIVVHDMSFAQKRSKTTMQYIFLFFTILAGVVSLITVIIAQMSLKGWLTSIRALLKGEGLITKPMLQNTSPEIRPIVKDLKAMIRDLESDKKVRDENQVNWNPRTLKEVLHDELLGD